MKFHPYSEVFPLLASPDLQALIADIKTNGLCEKIWTYEGKILDGRNRFIACNKAGVKPRFQAFKGTDLEAIARVASANIHRRHLTESQLAMAATRIATLSTGRTAASQMLPGEAITQTQAAEQFNVSRTSVQRARRVIDKGSKSLQQAVESGDVGLKKAAAVVDLPKSEQLAAATRPADKPSVEDDRWIPDDDEAEQIAAAEKNYTDSIDKVMAADDKLAAAHVEIKRQAAEIASLKVSRDGYLNGKSAITKLLKKEQSKAEQLSRQLDKAKTELDKLRERIAIMSEAV